MPFSMFSRGNHSFGACSFAPGREKSDEEHRRTQDALGFNDDGYAAALAG